MTRGHSERSYLTLHPFPEVCSVDALGEGELVRRESLSRERRACWSQRDERSQRSQKEKERIVKTLVHSQSEKTGEVPIGRTQMKNIKVPGLSGVL